MGSILARFLLFLSSYFPLAAIFFILFVGKQPWVAIGILSIGLLGLLGMTWYLRVVNRIGPIQVKVRDIQRRDAEAMSYIVSYLIPFLAVPFNGWEQGFALSIFFVVLGILYVNSNMIHINPMLNLVGFHLYEITFEDGAIHSLITRRRIVRGEKLSVIKVGEDILLEKRL
jgi:phosphatidylglycerophosphate synthase